MILETVSSDPVHVGRWLHPCRGRTVLRRPLLSTQAPEPGTDDAVAEKLFIQAQEMVELVNNTTIEYVSLFEILSFEYSGLIYFCAIKPA